MLASTASSSPLQMPATLGGSSGLLGPEAALAIASGAAYQRRSAAELETAGVSRNSSESSWPASSASTSRLSSTSSPQAAATKEGRERGAQSSARRKSAWTRSH